MIQVCEQGFQLDDDPIQWGVERTNGSWTIRPPLETPSDPAHRRWLLDREHKRGNHPGPDGWLVIQYWDDLMYGRRVRNYTRLRWLDELEVRCR